VTAPSDALPFAGAVAIASAPQDPAPAPAERPAQPSGPSQPSAQPAPAQPTPQINVEVHERGWYASPMWIAIGVIGLVVLILVVAMASRTTGSNTVIRG
jgi:hypothetical protein